MSLRTWVQITVENNKETLSQTSWKVNSHTRSCSLISMAWKRPNSHTGMCACTHFHTHHNFTQKNKWKVNNFCILSRANTNEDDGNTGLTCQKQKYAHNQGAWHLSNRSDSPISYVHWLWKHLTITWRSSHSRAERCSTPCSSGVVHNDFRLLASLIPHHTLPPQYKHIVICHRPAIVFRNFL